MHPRWTTGRRRRPGAASPRGAARPRHGGLRGWAGSPRRGGGGSRGDRPEGSAECALTARALGRQPPLSTPGPWEAAAALHSAAAGPPWTRLLCAGAAGEADLAVGRGPWAVVGSPVRSWAGHVPRRPDLSVPAPWAHPVSVSVTPVTPFSPLKISRRPVTWVDWSSPGTAHSLPKSAAEERGRVRG